MSIVERIEKDFVAAYKAKDQKTVTVLRLLKSAIKLRQVELEKPTTPLDDNEMLNILGHQAKQRRDSIEQYAAAGRQDLADSEAAELAILQKYLPQPLTEAELVDVVKEAIKATGAKGMRDMGGVMQHIMQAYKGRVDGKQLSALVRKQLVG